MSDPFELRVQFPAYLIEAHEIPVERRTIPHQNFAALIENIDDVVEFGSRDRPAP